jgi:hypothetical protein
MDGLPDPTSIHHALAIPFVAVRDLRQEMLNTGSAKTIWQP